MTEPQPELEATANLSPVSPSPVHTAAPQVVPALQDTVDTINAMVAAVADVAEAGDEQVVIDPAMSATHEDVADDDATDPYGDEDETSREPQGPPSQPQEEPADNIDDYAKTFDSPISAEEQEDQEGESVAAPPAIQEQPHSSPSPEPAANTSPTDPLPSLAQHETADAHNVESDATAPSALEAEATLHQPAQTADPESADTAASTAADPGAVVDIQKLMADLAAQKASEPTAAGGAGEPAQAEAPTDPVTPSSTIVPGSSLPPRPPQPQTTPNQQPSFSGAGASATGSSLAPGISLPSNPVGSSADAPAYDAPARGYAAEGGQDVEYNRQWEQFMTDERQYMSDAKWDRFPDGSRLFIGNLSSDKVSKRDVFDLFHRFGRLAQISLKSAYGFVQYHTLDEGRLALENLQGIDIKGRRIHLEISRVQDKSKKERNRSPDRGRGRRNNDKHSQSGRDDYRPGRNQSPRRDDYGARDGGYGGRDRGYGDAGRNRARSRSPGYGRGDRDSYRRRSPSPRGRSRQEPELDLPSRYGAAVPDVQFILQPDVNRDFVSWVEGAFKAKGLKTEVMHLHPRMPKDQIIQRQAAEGVHGVIELDMRAQSLGRIPVQVFDRSAGTNNVRFDQYVDLDPGTAAEVIIRARASAAPAAPAYGQGYAPHGGYQPPYGAQPQQHNYGAAPRPGAYPPQQQSAPAPSAADIASLMGKVDNATLQQLLASIQAPGGGAPVAGAYPHGGSNAPSVAPNPQVDIQAILGSLGGAPQQPPQQGHYGAYGGQASTGGNGDPAAQAQVQNIMAQLARYRQ